MVNNDYDVSLSAQHIAANLEKYEAARTGFFVFLVNEALNEKIRDKIINTFGRTAELLANASEAIKLNVVKASVPSFKVNVLEYTRGNEKIKFAGTPEWGDGSITVDDVVGLDTKAILLGWKELAYDTKTRKGGRMKDYKYDCTLIEYTQDYEPLRTWTLYGCWVSEVSDEDFDKENDGKRQLTATIQYDRAEMIDQIGL